MQNLLPPQRAVSPPLMAVFVRIATRLAGFFTQATDGFAKSRRARSVRRACSLHKSGRLNEGCCLGVHRGPFLGGLAAIVQASSGHTAA